MAIESRSQLFASSCGCRETEDSTPSVDLPHWGRRRHQRSATVLRLYQPPHIGELVDRGTRASKIEPLILK
jgi:hypothetical protein